MRSITIKDNVYGTVKIKEPILIELLKSKAVLRLKKINQVGLKKEWRHGINFIEYSRYDHSTGVLVLLKKLNAPLKEQIAGLLHDVSHMAFSHVYDYLIENHDESFGDDIFFDFLKKDSEIMTIFKKYKITLKEISNFEKFKILERDSPDLCVDRIDYTLREYLYLTDDKKTVDSVVDDLIVFENEVIFKTKKSALFFYKTYKHYAENYWSGYLHSYKVNLFVKVLKRAIELKVISLDDFYKTDDYILNKINKLKDPFILKHIKLLEDKDLKGFKKHSGFKGKKRFVNPKYLFKGKVRRII